MASIKHKALAVIEFLNKSGKPSAVPSEFPYLDFLYVCKSVCMVCVPVFSCLFD